MKLLITAVVALSLSCIRAQPISQPDEDHRSIWEGTPMDAVVQQYQQQCLEQPQSGACVKVKVLNLVDEVLSKDAFKVTDGVSIVPNVNKDKEVASETGRSSNVDSLKHLENYVKSHDVVFRSPSAYLQGTTFKFSPRNIDNNELNLSVEWSSEDENSVTESRGRKSKLKKILVPILVFVLLKAMTLIPLAIGVLGLKAWNALQLSFISFLVSISLAIFQLCKKIAADTASPPIATHIPLDASHYAAARNLVLTPDQTFVSDTASDIDAQNLAYNAYAQS